MLSYICFVRHYLINTRSRIHTKTDDIGKNTPSYLSLSTERAGPYKQDYHHSSIKERPRDWSKMTDENMGLW